MPFADKALPQPARGRLENGRDSEVCGFSCATARTKREDKICDQALCDYLFAIDGISRVQEPQTPQSLPKSVCPLLKRGFSTSKIVTGPDSRPDFFWGAHHEVRDPRGRATPPHATHAIRNLREPRARRAPRASRDLHATRTPPTHPATCAPRTPRAPCPAHAKRAPRKGPVGMFYAAKLTARNPRRR